jgi:hypothetical protein
MKATAIRVHPLARCSFCGAPYKAFDFKVEPTWIAHDCRRCHARIIEIEFAPARSEKPAYEATGPGVAE